jgi:hypothetical protein
MDSERIDKSLQSAMQLLAARDAVLEVVDALEALAEGQMPDPQGLEVDVEGGRSLRDGVADVEMLNGTRLLSMLLGDGCVLCREQAKKLAANLRDFAGADKSS